MPIHEPQHFQILLAQPYHLKEIQACADQAYEKYIERIGKIPAPMYANFAQQIESKQVYVGLIQNSFVGYIVSYKDKGVWHIENVAVKPGYAGKGLGKSLIAFAEQLALDGGCSVVELYTNEAMTENLGFYQSLGYSEIERKQQNGFKRVFFRKQLNS